jgi:hypothetical protein
VPIAAAARAEAIRAGQRLLPATQLALPTRIVAIGDPQASSTRFFDMLGAHELLATDGWLRPDVRLISMGDHFDYPDTDRARARTSGVEILGWLAAHPREHVTILFGNHDAARVMELATVGDERFAAAASAAELILALPRDQREASEAAFIKQFPDVATPGYAARDYQAFTVEQRALVQRLLLVGRFDLAATTTKGRTPVLLTHAGVTQRELAQLHVHSHPHTIADALNDRLRIAIAGVAEDWRAGKQTQLSLAPFHLAGADGEEGGGLLYHRPSDPARPGADPSWEQAARAPRRYDPHVLPRGLVQVVGHTGHHKASKEMPNWRVAGTDEKRGGIRTLRVSGDVVTYERGIHLGEPTDAIVWMIDPEMHYVPTPADVEILDLL